MNSSLQDPIWAAIRKTTIKQAEQEPILASFLHSTILNHDSLEDALSYQLANKLESPIASALLIREIVEQALEESSTISQAVRADIVATYERDSACDCVSTPLLFYKGYATGIVIGETAVIDDDVSIMQSVTLGGTGKENGDRHPKIHRGVLIGVGCKILGNIDIGEGAHVSAGSVVLKPVPPHKVVAGVPAKMRQRLNPHWIWVKI